MRTIIVLSALLAVAGCDRRDRTEANDTRDDPASAAADNTKKNERDRDPRSLTPGDQGESEADRDITAQVRRDVMKSEELSVSAKNVKIITNGGIVTLRGPVKSEEEKEGIAVVAQRVDGVKKVDNQLEVAVR